ncbi:TrmH family RNA methyltransferase [Amycolatopsis minnesotensis]|uniref:TrmH family RNA methyltransferase n=1 Tax=Amycolatopsis minnesotensis TaxID=337894 RepID=A0ABP5BL18_9PSEU
MTPHSPGTSRSRRRSHPRWGHLLAAPHWPLHGANLGTLPRTCDAVGACLAVPRIPWVPEALRRGDTLRRPACVHGVNDPLADEAARLAGLGAARGRTIAVLGHEQSGIPPGALDLLDVAEDIPMAGSGSSLNVAVAGRLVRYELAGLA